MSGAEPIADDWHVIVYERPRTPRGVEPLLPAYWWQSGARPAPLRLPVTPAALVVRRAKPSRWRRLVAWLRGPWIEDEPTARREWI